MRIVFMGTSQFAVFSLEKLFSDYKNICVFTQSDKPKGRGLHLEVTPVKKKAEELGLKVFQPKNLKDKSVLNALNSLNPDLIVVVSYGHILPPDILKFSGKGCINLHASLLPRYRGPAPIQWAIIKGERETGVTVMFMDEGIDTGDIILQKAVLISNDDTHLILSDKLAREGGNLLLEVVKLIEEGKTPKTKQDNSSAIYAPLIKKQDGLINWSKSAQEIYDLVRAMFPWPSAFTYCNNKRVKIIEIKQLDTNSKKSPGEIVKTLKEEGIVVSTGQGDVLITKIQPENKKIMPAEDFCRGYKPEKLGK